ncbi:hypothetical protein GF336_01100 [Candidatus Woesearchaeota archaeon]|nr:hypothetical protein [Candidatus Woesearchaeota archaeon]
MFIGGIYDRKKSRKQIDSDLDKIKKINCFSSVKYNTDKFSCKGFGMISIVPERAYKNFRLKEFKDIVIGFQGDILKETLDGLYERYKKEGENFVKELDGCFNIAVYEKKNKILRLFNDRSAYFGMYYSFEDKFTFGTNIKSNLMFNGKKELDEDSVMELFHLGHLLGEKTLFKDIKHLKQASVLEFSKGLKIENYWAPRFNRSRRNKRWFTKEFNRRLKSSVNKCLYGKKEIGLALSGGLDSRAVAAAIEKERFKIKSFSYGDKRTNDFKFGKLIAKKLGFEHFSLEINDFDLMDIVPFIVWQTEGNVSFEGCLSPVYHRTLLEKKISYRVGGASGDICSGGHIQPYMLFCRNKKRFLKKLLKKKEFVPSDIQKKIFDEDFFRRKRKDLKKSFAESLSETKEKNLADMNDIWDFKNRQRNFIFSSNQVDRHLFENIEPFLDKEMLELWLKVPLRYRFFQNYYKKAILRLNKKIKDVPWAHTGKRIHGNIVLDLISQGINLLSKKTKAIFSKFYFDKGQGMMDMRKMIMKNERMKNELLNFIASNEFPDTILNKQEIVKLTDDHYNGGSDNSKAINLLLTLDHVLKYMSFESIPKEAEEFMGEISG